MSHAEGTEVTDPTAFAGGQGCVRRQPTGAAGREPGPLDHTPGCVQSHADRTVQH